MTGTVGTVAALRERIAGWRRARQSVALVPTMGALHEGHLSLVRLARERADRCCVSIFVNPTQFGPSEDFESYPRDPDGDVEKLADEGADLVFMPDPREMYPADHATVVRVGGVGEVLEEEFRPGFFTGVATVVTKLLLQALPDVAVFGEKDYQQLQVIRRLVRDLDVPVDIVGAPVVREADGLALSSRNAYLTAQERAVAPALYRSLHGISEALRGDPRRDVEPLEVEARASLLRAGFGPIDYLTVRSASTLRPFDGHGPARVLGAAWLGRARLIDNVAVPA